MCETRSLRCCLRSIFNVHNRMPFYLHQRNWLHKICLSWNLCAFSVFGMKWCEDQMKCSDCFLSISSLRLEWVVVCYETLNHCQHWNNFNFNAFIQKNLLEYWNSRLIIRLVRQKTIIISGVMHRLCSDNQNKEPKWSPLETKNCFIWDAMTIIMHWRMNLAYLYNYLFRT